MYEVWVEDPGNNELFSEPDYGISLHTENTREQCEQWITENFPQYDQTLNPNPLHVEYLTCTWLVREVT
jgi:hypothetical protein